MFDLNAWQWCLIIFAAFMTGFSKTGISGLGILAVIILASVFPPKESTGIFLPMLIFGDVFAIAFYRRHADWKILWRLFPFVVPGIIGGYFFLAHVSNKNLKVLIGIIVLILLAGQWVLRRAKMENIAHPLFLAAFFGMLAGFTTMTSNAAGPIMAAYLLLMNLKKMEFIGTQAWYFFSMNCFKVPFSANLGLITWETLKFNCMIFPAIFVGAILGRWLLRYIPQKWFDVCVQVLAALGGLKLILG